MAQHLGTSQSSQNLRASYAYQPHRLPPSASSASLLLPHSASFQSFGNERRARSSGTWTTSSGELGLLDNADEVEDRDVFVQEYNRLAKKHGVRQLVTEDFQARHGGDVDRCPEKRGWISRLLRPSPNRCPHASSMSPPPPPPPRQVRHKRSVSEFANIIHCRKEAPKVIEIQEMVRLGGKSILYLPQDYSPCSLTLPTCIRATAQYLAQNVATRGLFRVPGSAKVISALFDYYCHMDHSDAKIAGTVRCATLPIHIQYSTHDVASTFKRLLSVLPGGVLGSLSLFDAFIAIHSQLNGEPEYPRTKQTKVRARLIALAIGTVRSQYRRELICAVFGLLSLIGRAAEIAPREDEDSRPLPTTDLMGYSALGIVFGPLLVGDLLESYTMKVATPTSGLLLFPLTPPRFRKDRRKSVQADPKAGGPPTVDRILIANDLTKMLISNWRDVVRQMKALGTHCRKDASTVNLGANQGAVFPSAQTFKIKAPKGFNEDHDGLPNSRAPKTCREPETPTHCPRPRRLKVLRRADSQNLLPKMSIATLSPTKEESLGDDEPSDREGRRESVIYRMQKPEKGEQSCGETGGVTNSQTKLDRQDIHGVPFVGRTSYIHSSYAMNGSAETPTTGASQVYLESVPPRESSKNASSHRAGGDSLPKRVVPEKITTPPLNSKRRENLAIPEPQAQQRAMDGIFNGVGEAEAEAPAEAPKSSKVSSSARGQTKALSEGGIRLVPNSPIPPVGERRLKSDPGPECVEPGPVSKVSVSHDQGIQCQMMAELERRHSIDSTPERFYPFPLAPAEAATPVTPDKSLSGLLSKQQEAEKHQRQMRLLRGPRLSKSDESLRGRTRITLDDQTEPTASKELTKKGSVKAMAALFELQPGFGERAASTENRARSRRHSRRSKSDSACTLTLDPRKDLAAKVLGMNGNYQRLALEQDVTKAMRRDEDGKSDGQELKSVPSLGTMLPCPEQPPIAQRLNLARPPSSPSLIMVEGESYSASEMVSPQPVSRAGSATVLYSQIRKLQRQLDAKTDEAAQLRRQLEAQKDSDVGTVSEQVRQAKRDVAAWKERAETAERRVKVFEGFTEKLKELRDAMAENEPRKPRITGPWTLTPCETTDGASDNAPKTVATLQMDQESRGSHQKEEPQSARRPEAQRGLHHGVARRQNGGDWRVSDSASDSREGPRWCNGGACACQKTCMDGSGLMWAAAEELLRMEEGRMAEETT